MFDRGLAGLDEAPGGKELCQFDAGISRVDNLDASGACGATRDGRYRRSAG
jgi:hypothetical protein